MVHTLDQFSARPRWGARQHGEIINSARALAVTCAGKNIPQRMTAAGFASPALEPASENILNRGANWPPLEAASI
jgi:hypothetical protein